MIAATVQFVHTCCAHATSPLEALMSENRPQTTPRIYEIRSTSDYTEDISAYELKSTSDYTEDLRNKIEFRLHRGYKRL